MVQTTLNTAGVAPVTGDVQLLVFQAAGEEYAFPLTEVREIIHTPTITPVPCVEPHVKGVLNLRGKIVTVVDLAQLLGLPVSTDLQHIIVVEKGAELFGFHVELVTGVLRVATADLKDVSKVITAKLSASSVEHAVVLETQKEGTTERQSRIILILHLHDILASLSPASS